MQYLADAKCLKFCDDTNASLAAVAAAAAQGLERTELLDTSVTQWATYSDVTSRLLDMLYLQLV